MLQLFYLFVFREKHLPSGKARAQGAATRPRQALGSPLLHGLMFHQAPRPSTHQVCAEQEGVTTPAVLHPAPQSRAGTGASPSSLASRYPRGQRGERLLPFLLQSGEVFFEGWADLVK